MMFRNTEKK